MIIGIEMFVFLFYCGLLFDFVLLFFFVGVMIRLRVFFIMNYLVMFIFVYWFVGIGYMFYFVFFVFMCRKIMCKGVFYFICDFDDLEFYLICDVLECSVVI